jgi:signal transduction histidine kinase
MTAQGQPNPGDEGSVAPRSPAQPTHDGDGDGAAPEERAGSLRARLHHARRRTVAGRLFGSYVLVIIAFAVTVGWSFQALSAASRDAELLRAGYVPLLLRIGEALAEQNVFNAQLNHITAAKNSGDVREWIEIARRTRPLTFSLVREAAERGLGSEPDPGVRRFREEIAREISAIEKSLENEPERFGRLFQALTVGDRDTAERAQNDLVKRGAEGAQRLRAMRVRVEEAMESLTAAARRREERSVQLLVGLGLLTLLVGIMTSLYARRVLAPLTEVTARADAVARGDLTPHRVVDTNDEIGELATTFEGMVAAIQRARSELVQAERLATIGKMAAHVTHEIRNPLSSIGLNVELLEEEVALTGDKEPMQLVQAIKSEVDRLSRIAEQYLSVARRPRPRLERERVDDLVRELCAFVRPELDRAGVESRVESDADLPEVELDESQLRQALLNLIRNAREAMPKGGELSIEVARVEEGVEIRVDDTGAGVPDDVRASIFDPFFTTKQRGTGLGLAVTREIVEAHHGSIHCEPRPERGTRFRIVLPAADQGRTGA